MQCLTIAISCTIVRSVPGSHQSLVLACVDVDSSHHVGYVHSMWVENYVIKLHIKVVAILRSSTSCSQEYERSLHNILVTSTPEISED